MREVYKRVWSCSFSSFGEFERAWELGRRNKKRVRKEKENVWLRIAKKGESSLVSSKLTLHGGLIPN